MPRLGTKVKQRVKEQRPKVMTIIDGVTGYVDLIDYEISEGVTFGSLINMFLKMKDVNNTDKFIAVEFYKDGSIKNAIPIHKIIEDQHIPKNVGSGFNRLNERNTIAFDKQKFAKKRRN